MSKKYIIELDDGFQDNDGNMLYKAIGTKSLVFDEYGIEHILQPYVMPPVRPNNEESESTYKNLVFHLQNINDHLEVYFNNEECRKFIEDRLPVENGKFSITQMLLLIGAWKYAMASYNLSVVDNNDIPAIPNKYLIKGYQPNIPDSDDMITQKRMNELVLTYPDIHEYVFNELKKTYPTDMEIIPHGGNCLSASENEYLSKIPIGDVCDKIMEFLSSTTDEKRIYRNLWIYYTEPECRKFVNGNCSAVVNNATPFSKMIFEIDSWERQRTEEEIKHKKDVVDKYSKDFIIAYSVLNDYPDIRQFVITNLHGNDNSSGVGLNHDDDGLLTTKELQFLSLVPTDAIYDEIRKFFEQCDKYKYHNCHPLRLYFCIPECKEWVDDDLVVEDNMINTEMLVKKSDQWIGDIYNTLFNNESVSRIVNPAILYNNNNLDDRRRIAYMVLSVRKNIREWVINELHIQIPNIILDHHERLLTVTERRLLSRVDVRIIETLIVNYLEQYVPDDEFNIVDQLIFYYYTKLDCMNDVNDKLFDKQGRLKTFPRFIQDIVEWLHANDKLDDINWNCAGQVELVNFMLMQSDRNNFTNNEEDE